MNGENAMPYYNTRPVCRTVLLYFLVLVVLHLGTTTMFDAVCMAIGLVLGRLEQTSVKFE